MASNANLNMHPTRQICDAWLSKIKLAQRVRHDQFGKYAEEAMRFYDGPHDFMWKNDYATGAGGFLDKEGIVLPTFRVTINNVFKAVALFGPALYHQNPNVQVTATLPIEVRPEALGYDPGDPYGMQEFQLAAHQEQVDYLTKKACAEVKEKYINWVQQETDKKTHSRRAITEAIVAGLGYLETTMFQPPASQIVMPRSTYVSWWDVVVDPDASYWEDVQWIALRRYRPVNVTAKRFGLEEEDLKGHLQSFDSQTTAKAKKEAKSRKLGQSFDLIEYWEVFSKNGFGDKLSDGESVAVKQKYDYSVFGDYCYLAVAAGVPFPLNLPTNAIADEEAQQLYERVQWPIPFWNDQDGWPICRLAFYENPNSVWPVSLFKPAIGEMRFVNWCMSFLADKVAASCHTYVGVLKSAGAQIQKQLAGTNTPFTVIEIAEALGIKNLNEAVSFLQAPNFPGDIWKMLAEVTQEIDEKTGVTELLQGLTSRSMRSAAEAQIKNERVSVRPDDMAARTEDFLGEVAVREIQAARWFCDVPDVAPCLGRMGAMIWQNYVMTSDPDQVVRDFNYRVEAGSARKPNKETKIRQLTELGQYALPVFQQFAALGQVAPYNGFMQAMCKEMDVDAQPFLIEPPPPPEQQGPTPEQQQAQGKLDLQSQELQLKVGESQAKLGLEFQQQHQELTQAQELHKLEMQKLQAEIAAKRKQGTGQ